MKFTRKNGRVVLDLAGSLVLRKGPALIDFDSQPAVTPKTVKNAKYFTSLGSQGLRNRLRASLIALKWIWTEH